MSICTTKLPAILLVVTVFLSFSPAGAGDIVTPSVIVKEIVLPGVSGEMVLTFEDATGLAGDSLAITAQPLTPDPCGVCLRLPQDVFPTSRFPVLITIVPDVAGLSFRGRWTLEIITDELSFLGDTPLRLFRARTNVGMFEDITRSVGFGSYRVSGTGGSFSQFLIAADHRPRGLVVGTKFDRLQAILDDPASGIDLGVLADLNQLAAQAEAAFTNGDLAAARAAVDDLRDTVISNSGDGIPDLWDPPLDPVSIAGRLRGILASLRFSLSFSDPARRPGSNAVDLTLEPAPGLALDVDLSFAESFDFDLSDPSSLGISAAVIDPVDVVARLPEGVQIPEAFPVLLTIDPAADQAFAGTYTLELSTGNLSFVGASPLRLFKAESKSPFEDVSASIGVGSYRVSGTGGSFSEFLIAADLRPVDDVLEVKFDRLDAFLNDNAQAVPQEVVDLFDQARTAFDNGDTAAAIDRLDDMLAAVSDNRETLPAIWRSDRSRVNVFGDLLGLARTLRFSLVLEDSPIEPDPLDVNRDDVVDAMDVFLVIHRVFGDGSSLPE